MKLDLTKFKKDIPAAAIMYFRDEFFFLSNMYPCQVTLPAEPQFNLPAFACDTVENAYMAWKTIDPTLRQNLAEADPKHAKETTHQENFPLRHDDSPQKRIALMQHLTLQKYNMTQNPVLHNKLEDTGDAPIFEGNIWGDTFWGVDLLEGQGGQNNLGKILMYVRAHNRQHKQGAM